MFTTLMVASGGFWLLTYLLIIKRGFQDRTFGMPVAAFSANISWEFIFTFILPHPAPHIYTNILAFSLDLIILFQILLFWDREFSNLSRESFYSGFISIILTSFFAVLFVTYLFQDRIGLHAAFGQNLMMSILFVIMLYNRKELRGQSVQIAILKMLGTAMASLAFFLYDPVYKGSIVLNLMYITTFLVDLLYIILTQGKTKEQSLS